MTELPPPYTELDPSSASLQRPLPHLPAVERNENPFLFRNTLERRSVPSSRDELELLRHYDTIFIVDDSSSMLVNEQPDGTIGPSRWLEACSALASVTKVAAQYDDDGIDIHFINSDRFLLHCRDPAQVYWVFDEVRPFGATPTGERLALLLLEYLDAIEHTAQSHVITGQSTTAPKPRNVRGAIDANGQFVIITDGAATDDLESVIVACAQRLDAGRFPLSQIGIQFIQVGNDAQATKSLRHCTYTDREYADASG